MVPLFFYRKRSITSQSGSTTLSIIHAHLGGHISNDTYCNVIYMFIYCMSHYCCVLHINITIVTYVVLVDNIVFYCAILLYYVIKISQVAIMYHCIKISHYHIIFLHYIVTVVTLNRYNLFIEVLKNTLIF